MNANMDIVDAHGGREEGVGAEAEEVVAVALFELGAGGPLMDKSSPQKVEKVPGVAEASREGAAAAFSTGAPAASAC